MRYYPTGRELQPGFQRTSTNHSVIISRLLIVLGAVTIGLFCQLFARTTVVTNAWKSARPAIFVDSWSGKSARNQAGYTTLFIELSPSELIFQKENDHFMAEISIETVIQNYREERIFNHFLRDTIPVANYEKTLDSEWNRFYKIVFSAPCGDFKAVLNITDENTGKTVTLQHTFSVNQATPSLGVSDFLLAKKETIALADKRTANSVLPYPAAIYGATLPGLYSYFELYDETGERADSIEYQISYVGENNQPVFVKSGRLQGGIKHMPMMNYFSTREMPPGEYKLVLTVRRTNGMITLEREKKFMIYQHPTDLRFRSFAEIIRELRLIASAEEWRELKNLAEKETDMAVLDQAVANFWQRRDPTPRTLKNELMIEFYKRSRMAEKLYRPEKRKSKALPDRYKAYVMLGKPDAIRVESDNTLMGFFEIWEYQQKGLRVVFRDKMGYGNFQLVKPDGLLGEVE